MSGADDRARWPMAAHVIALASELVSNEEAQDVVEYALLTALIGVAAIAIWQQIATKVGVLYTAADSGVQAVSACTPDPGGGGCP